MEFGMQDGSRKKKGSKVSHEVVGGKKCEGGIKREQGISEGRRGKKDIIKGHKILEGKIKRVEMDNFNIQGNLLKDLLAFL